MKHVVLAVAATAAITVGSAGGAHADTHAAAKNPSCMTVKEYDKLRTGDTLKKVGKVVGGKGRVLSWGEYDGYRSEVRTFTACAPYDRYSTIAISFSNDGYGTPLRVDAASSYWVHN
ncbi:hypothetical protein KIH74_04790 [Kineosporia sp. J2-2]|uniref:Secreted protein n=1 Tax=Kineosporia corallincola TaxID=2835133 RepID=A0ABS5TAY4_9ACTN|nr:hypothetical protein [Kineosporia corallincola]MBT0768226.1 hypothetical protein [Kineosporia corallincola]